MREKNGLDALHDKFRVSNESRRLFEEIALDRDNEKEEILRKVKHLIKKAGFAYALAALYRQQVNAGFVLADPLDSKSKQEKTFFDPQTGITFCVQWNPDRELRKNHDLLVDRGVIKEKIDESRLINKDENGKACYLCKHNIEIQFPKQVLVDVVLAGERFFVGANPAYITNNHFTVINSVHRPQLYRPELPAIMNDFVDQTNSHFRAIYNGVGYSIHEHEHLQATTEKFPIEDIKIGNDTIIYKGNGVKVSQPNYYIPVWVIEGADKKNVEAAANLILTKWHDLDKEHFAENIIATRVDKIYRTFIILRDKRRLAGSGKASSAAAFEAGGFVVLSYVPSPDARDKTNERKTFNNASLDWVKRLLGDISPEREASARLCEFVRQEF